MAIQFPGPIPPFSLLTVKLSFLLKLEQQLQNSFRMSFYARLLCCYLENDSKVVNHKTILFALSGQLNADTPHCVTI